MKRQDIAVVHLILILILLIGCFQNDSFSGLKGPYLGQKPPGMAPELFAPGIISTELHDDAAPAFSPDGKDVYFRIVYKIGDTYYGTIFVIKQENGRWSYPETASFSGKHMDGGVKFSPDGRKLYFGSVRQSKDGSVSSGMDLWEVRRIDDTWSEPKCLNDLNSNNNDMNPCVSSEGMLYWITERMRNDPKPLIYRSKIVNGNWIKKEKVDFFPVHSFIARIYAFGPNDSYILLTMRTPENDIDMFVSFKNDDDTWGDPINLGSDINSSSMDKCPTLSPDGKYLFFVSSREHQYRNPQKKWHSPLFKGHEKIFSADIYWVDAKIIEKLKPELPR